MAETYPITPNAAGATTRQYERLVAAVHKVGRDGNLLYPKSEAMIDASVTLRVLEAAGLRVVDAVELVEEQITPTCWCCGQPMIDIGAGAFQCQTSKCAEDARDGGR